MPDPEKILSFVATFIGGGLVGGLLVAYFNHVLARRRDAEETTRTEASEKATREADRKIAFFRFMAQWRSEVERTHYHQQAVRYPEKVHLFRAEAATVRGDFSEGLRREFDGLVTSLSSLTTEQINDTTTEKRGRDLIAERIDAIVQFVERH